MRTPMPVRSTPQRIQIPTGGSQGTTGMDQVQQQIQQIQQIPGLDDLEGLLGGNLDSLGGGTASQFFQNLARQASSQAGGQRSGLGVDDSQFQGLGNGNVNPL